LKISRSLAKIVATLGPIGYMPIAPGTWGSAVGVAFLAFVPLSPAGALLAIALAVVIGTAAAGIAERAIGEPDSGHIVIDEFAGMLISLFGLPDTYGYLAAGFLLFRIFDILKPFPIRRIDQTIPGGVGIMADDLLAGVYTNIVLQIWKMTF